MKKTLFLSLSGAISGIVISESGTPLNTHPGKWFVFMILFWIASELYHYGHQR